MADPEIVDIQKIPPNFHLKPLSFDYNNSFYYESHTAPVDRSVSRSPTRKQKLDPGRISLLLDLDQTLVDVRDYHTPNSMLVELPEKDYIVMLYATKRPGIENFLSTLVRYYNIYVFTASEKQYAIEITRATGIKKFIHKLYHRNHCIKTFDNQHRKYIERLGFKPSKTILIDDSILQIRPQIESALLIDRFDGKASDNALDRLLPFLISISKLSDVRPVTSRYIEYCSEVLLNKGRTIKRPRSPNNFKKLVKKSDSMPVSFEIEDFDDFGHYDGEKAFEGKSPYLDNPIASLKEKIASGHVQTILTGKFSGKMINRCFIKQDTIFQNKPEDSKEDDLLSTAVGNVPSTTPNTKSFKTNHFMRKRAEFAPPPTLFLELSGDSEIDHC